MPAMSSENQSNRGSTSVDNANNSERRPPTSNDISTNIRKMKEVSTFLVDQVEKIQDGVATITKEQQLFHCSTNERLAEMEDKFTNLTKEMTSLLMFFHEVVGVMNGTRTWTSSHPNTISAVQHETALVTNSNTSTSLSETRSQEDLDNEEPSSANTREHASSLASKVQKAFADTLSKDVDQEKQTVLESRVKQEPLTNSDLLKRIGDGRVYIRETELKDKSLNIYKLNRKLETVMDLAQEYFHGLKHMPSVQSLDSKYGTLWRKNDRSFYSKRMVIINKIKDIKEHPDRYNLHSDISLNMAVRVVENIKLGNNSFANGQSNEYIKMSLAALYEYFQKKKDRPSDYSLILEKEGRTRKEIAFQKKYQQMREAGIDFSLG